MSKKKHIVGDSALFDAVSREISALEAVAGTLPSRKNFEKYN